ncbi:hypothetical protein KSS87_017790, partial [Heliosperma pusillum]
GVSFHATPCRKSFHKYAGGRCGTAYLANGKVMPIMRSGDVKIRTPTGGRWELTDVMFIPNLKKKLISVGKLDEAGYKVVFEGSSWKIVKEGMVVARGTKSGTLYTTLGCWRDGV